ncbi:ferredoxin [Mycobacterium colombiense]
MRIEVDRDRCEGHGMCEVVAPEYFALDDDGDLTVLVEEVAEGDQDQVSDAALACPVAALKLTGAVPSKVQQHAP